MARNLIQEMLSGKDREDMGSFAKELVESGAFLAPVSAPIMKAIQSSGGKFVNSINTTYGPAYLIEDPATGKLHRFFADQIEKFGLPRFGPETQRPTGNFIDWLFGR